MLNRPGISDEKKLATCHVFLHHAKSLTSQGITVDFIHAPLDGMIRTNRITQPTFQILLQAGVIRSAWTMHQAIRNGFINVCRLLVQHGVDPFHLEEKGGSLFLAAASDDADTNSF